MVPLLAELLVVGYIGSKIFMLWLAWKGAMLAKKKIQSRNQESAAENAEVSPLQNVTPSDEVDLVQQQEDIRPSSWSGGVPQQQKWKAGKPGFRATGILTRAAQGV